MNDVDCFLDQVLCIKVLVIDNDTATGEALNASLAKFGVKTSWARTGAEALVLYNDFKPNIALLDINIPDIDGISLVSLLAQKGDCGVIIVSGLSDEADRIVCLELGADDYIPKPPHPRELVARIRAVYRRVPFRDAIKKNPPHSFIRLGKLQIDLKGRVVRAEDGTLISLTAAEFKALEVMIEARGETVTRDCLSESALHRPWLAEQRGVDQLIFSLREKLGCNHAERLIHTVRGVGYMVCSP
jgi:two-component system OmpR family response regulator